MNRKRKLMIVAGVAVLALAVGGGAIALNQSDSDQPISGDALEKAKEAAVDHTNGGRVTETEVGDEEGYYEVEVTLENGRQVDVHLDENFNVIGDEADEELPDDNDTASDED